MDDNFLKLVRLAWCTAIAAGILGLQGCGNDDDQPLVPPPNDSDFSLVVNVVVDGEGVSMGTLYQDLGGTAVRFDRLAFYLSGFGFENGEGEVAYPTGVKAFLFDGDQTAPMALPGLQRGGHAVLHLHAGLPPEINHADPLQASFPLDIPSMHWNWNPDLGYIFARIEGMYDANGDGVIDLNDSEFQYHCASTELLRSFSLSLEDVNIDDTLELTLDMRELLLGLDIASDPIGHGEVDPTVKIMNNFSRAVDVAQ
jgi:hypothetical protein